MNTDLDRTLSALADPARRSAVDLLRRKPLRASELAETLALTRPAMSRHLRVLREAGLVREEGLEADARARVYHLEREPFTKLAGWVQKVEAFWEDQLGAFKAHAERSARKRP